MKRKRPTEGQIGYRWLLIFLRREGFVVNHKGLFAIIGRNV
jgi:hypothetical protein